MKAALLISALLLVHSSLTAGQEGGDEVENVMPVEEVPEGEEGGDEMSLTAPAICSQPRNPGPYYGGYVKWFYNSTSEECEAFVYGGLGGNTNKFVSKSVCENTCSKDVCRLPQDIGRCLALIKRWYFNEEKMSCESFIYSGCGGNRNNFKSLEECETRCPVTSDADAAAEGLQMEQQRIDASPRKYWGSYRYSFAPYYRYMMASASKGAMVYAPGYKGAMMYAPGYKGAMMYAPGYKGSVMLAPTSKGSVMLAPMSKGSVMLAPTSKGSMVKAPPGFYYDINGKVKMIPGYYRSLLAQAAIKG